MNQSRIGLANPSCPCSVAERCHWPHRFSRRPDKLCYRNLIKVQRPTRLRPGAIVFIGKNSRGKWVARNSTVFLAAFSLAARKLSNMHYSRTAIIPRLSSKSPAKSNPTWVTDPPPAPCNRHGTPHDKQGRRRPAEHEGSRISGLHPASSAPSRQLSRPLRSANPAGTTPTHGGLTSLASQDSQSRLRRKFNCRQRPRSCRCFARHFGPGPRI